MGEFRITDNKGFHLIFDSGIILSTQFGPGNYCDNYDAPFLLTAEERAQHRGYRSFDAEVAIFKNGKDGDWITQEYEDNGDSVLPRVDFNEWLKIVDWCRNYKKPVIESSATPQS